MQNQKMPKIRLTGKVIRNKMQKTVIVEVSRVLAHSKYGKRLTRTKKFYAHTEDPIELETKVIIQEVKPVSKMKRWRVVEVLDDKGKSK